MININLKDYIEINNIDLKEIFEAISVSSIEVLGLLKSNGFINKKSTTSKNFSGDVQNKLDIASHNVFVENLLNTRKVSTIISEEYDNPINYKHTIGNKHYSVVLDPLDGSSNIDCNIPVGTIFGIYENSNVLTEGKNLICSGYVIYSIKTELIMTLKKGVLLFCYEPNEKQFILKNDNLVFPEKEKKIFSVNIGNCDIWDEEVKNIFFDLIEKGFSSRYIGSMVADFHRTLLYGGIFSYPKDKKNLNGKLRLLYECNPISLITEQAGGISIDGRNRILDLRVEKIHQKTSFFCGSPKIMREIFY